MACGLVGIRWVTWVFVVCYVCRQSWALELGTQASSSEVQSSTKQSITLTSTSSLVSSWSQKITSSSAPDITSTSPDVSSQTSEVTSKGPVSSSQSSDVTKRLANDVTSPSPDISSRLNDVISPAPVVQGHTVDVTSQVADVSGSNIDVTSRVPDVSSVPTGITSHVPEVSSRSTDVTSPEPEVRRLSTDVTSSAPKVSSRSTDAPEISSRSTDAPEISSRSTDAPEVSSRSTDAPEVSSRSTDAPEVSSRATDAPELVSRSTDAPEVSSRSTGVPELRSQSTGAPGVSSQPNDITSPAPEVRSPSTDLTSQAPETISLSTDVTRHTPVLSIQAASQSSDVSSISSAIQTTTSTPESSNPSSESPSPVLRTGNTPGQTEVTTKASKHQQQPELTTRDSVTVTVDSGPTDNVTAESQGPGPDVTNQDLNASQPLITNDSSPEVTSEHNVQTEVNASVPSSSVTLGHNVAHSTSSPPTKENEAVKSTVTETVTTSVASSDTETQSAENETRPMMPMPSASKVPPLQTSSEGPSTMVSTASTGLQHQIIPEVTGGAGRKTNQKLVDIANPNGTLNHDLDVNRNLTNVNEIEVDAVSIYESKNNTNLEVMVTNSTTEENQNETRFEPFVVIVEKVVPELEKPFSKMQDVRPDPTTAPNNTTEPLRRKEANFTSQDAQTEASVSSNQDNTSAVIEATKPNLNSSLASTNKTTSSNKNKTSRSHKNKTINFTKLNDGGSKSSTTEEPQSNLTTEKIEAKVIQDLTNKPSGPRNSSRNDPKRTDSKSSSEQGNASFSVPRVSTEESTAGSSFVENLTRTSIYVTDGTSPPPPPSSSPLPTTISAPAHPSSTELGNDTDSNPWQEETDYRVTGVIKIVKGAAWTADLADRKSSEFIVLAAKLKLQLDAVYHQETLGPYLREIEIDSFSEGSVLAMFTLVLTTKLDWLDSHKLKSMITRGLQNGHLGDFKLDPDYTSFRVHWPEDHTPLELGNAEPPIPQWAIAVIVVAAACLIFSLLFAAVTVYGRGQTSPRKYDKEGMLESPGMDWERKMAAAYENMAADNISEREAPKRRSFRDEPLRRPLERSDSLKSYSSVRRVNPDSNYALNS